MWGPGVVKKNRDSSCVTGTIYYFAHFKEIKNEIDVLKHRLIVLPVIFLLMLLFFFKF